MNKSSIKNSTVPSIPSGNVTKDHHHFLNDGFTVESEAGAIAGLIFGILVVIGMVSLFLLMMKRKRDNDRQYQKQLRIQRSTKQNAGVYMDTTMLQNLVSPREVKGPTAYASLSDRNKDLYEIDSGDEI